MANSQMNPDMNNAPTWGYKPTHLGKLLNQGGKDRGTGRNQALADSLPEIMNQGGSTEHPGNHPEGHMKKPMSLKERMGQ